MAIRDWLAGGRNVTAGWVRDPSLRLALDFSTGTLCGVGLGEPVERLSFLGPTDRKPKPGHDLEFLALGVSVGLSGDRIDSYSVWWRDDLEAGYQPYSGSVLLQGRHTSLGGTTQEPEILSNLGPPYWRDQDDSESGLGADSLSRGIASTGRQWWQVRHESAHRCAVPARPRCQRAVCFARIAAYSFESVTSRRAFARKPRSQRQ